MTLRIDRISFRDFRSYERLELSELGALTVLHGPNAAGKTNIVEGIQLLTAQGSFRHPTVSQLVRMGAPAAHIEAHATDGSRDLTLALALAEGKKRFELNGKPKKAVDLKGVVPSVTFTPDDLTLAKGPHAGRRAALDTLGSQLSRNHYLIRRDYEKVLRHKNALLKDEAPAALLQSVNDMVITCGAQLVCYRAALFERVAAAMRRHYAQIAEGEQLGAVYEPSWAVSRETCRLQGSGVSRETPSVGAPAAAGVAAVPVADAATPAPAALTRDAARKALAAALEERFAEERARRRALVGPHADHVTFTIDGRDAGLFASQGQQRSIVLAFKLAEAAVVEDVIGQKPVLLLDDVMSELDAHRRRALVSFILRDIQTFITTANLDYFDRDLLAAARVVRLPLETAL